MPVCLPAVHGVHATVAGLKMLQQGQYGLQNLKYLLSDPL